MPVPKTGPGDHSQSDHDSKSNTRPPIQPGTSSSHPEMGHFLRFSIQFHCSEKLRFPSTLFKKYLNCFCHGFLFLMFLLSRKSQCSPMTFSPVSWKRRPSYCCLLRLWTQMEFMALWVVFITVLKAWQMSSTQTPVRLFLPQAPHASQLLRHTRQGSSAWREWLLS